MTLPVMWFALVAVFWTGFFVLEGFDFGVGALHRRVGRTEVERRVAINAVGPWWDGNEVWLIVAGAAMFAAFPAWYATWFSALYLALVLVLMALIVRGVSFEFRRGSPDQRWRRTWSTTLVVGSALAPLLIGIGIGDLLAGLPLDSDQEFTGTFWSLLTPFGLLVGITLLVLCLLHGATFLGLRTDGEVHARAAALASTLRWAALALGLATAGATLYLGNRSVLSWLLLVTTAGGLAVACSAVGRREGRAFAGTAVAIGSTVAAVFAGLYPDVLVSSTDPANSLTVESAAAGSYSLQVMTWVAVVLVPVVLAYQGWSYHVFRARLRTPAADPQPAA